MSVLDLVFVVDPGDDAMGPFIQNDLAADLAIRGVVGIDFADVRCWIYHDI